MDLFHFPSYYGIYFMGGIAVLVFLLYIIFGRIVFSSKSEGGNFHLWEGHMPDKVEQTKQIEAELREAYIGKRQGPDAEEIEARVAAQTAGVDAEATILGETVVSEETEKDFWHKKTPLAKQAEAISWEETMVSAGRTAKETAAEADDLDETKVTSVHSARKKGMEHEETKESQTVGDVQQDETTENNVQPVAAAPVVTTSKAAQREEVGKAVFGPNMCWLAIRGGDSNWVTELLGLTEVRHAHWQEGLAAAYGDGMPGQIFVSPMVNDWVLVVGKPLWNKLDMDCRIQDNDWFMTLLEATDELQYYSTHRDTNNHAWIKGRHGAIQRAYGYCGELDEVMWNIGPITTQEYMLGFNADAKGQLSRKPLERDVLVLSALWSVDTTFSNTPMVPADGFIGKLN